MRISRGAESDGRSPMADTQTPASLLRSGQAQGEWILDPAGTTVEFGVKHFWHLITVHGRFEQVEGSGTVGPDGAVSGRLVMRADSLNTKNKQRDKHLRSGDFFDAENHPDAVLTVASAVPAGDDQLTVTGTLEAAGHAQPVTFTARVEADGERAVTLRAELTVDRTALGMTWSPLGMAAAEATATVKARFTRA
jgi:polyisoprenoid-binding protein YceI